jgi:hypothetical protein
MAPLKARKVSGRRLGRRRELREHTLVEYALNAGACARSTRYE